MALDNYKYLLVGANSFIGKRIYLGLSSIVEKNNIYRLVRSRTEDGVNIIQCDLESSSKLNVLLSEIEFDVVIYLVARTSASRDMFEYDSLYSANFKALKNTLDIFKDKNRTRFIYFSTSEVYGNKVFEPDESSCLMPVSIYSLTKVMAEELIKYYVSMYDMSVTVVRPSLVYGVGQSDRFFISNAVEKIVNGERFDMTYGEQTRDYIYVDDVVSAVISIIRDKRMSGEVVNVSSNEEVSLRELVSMIKVMAGSLSKINFGAIEYRDNEIMRYKIDNSKIKKMLSWDPKFSLYEGVGLMLEKYKK